MSGVAARFVTTDAAAVLLWSGRCDAPQDTRAVGAALAAVLEAGGVLVLSGRLGAGKTTLVKGLAAGLGVAADVTSPTFVLARELRGGRLPLIHVDAYRLGSAWELDDLELDTDLADAVVAVEWGDGLAERLSAHRVEVRLDRSAADDTRSIDVRGVGARWARVSPLAVAAQRGPR